MTGGRSIVARALLAAIAVAAVAALDACARGRVDELTTDVPLSGMSKQTDDDVDYITDGPVDEYGDPIKPVFDVPTTDDDVGAPTMDAGAPLLDVHVVVDIGSCGTAGHICCTNNACTSGLSCTSGVCAEAPACGSWNQPCCGAACGPGLSCSVGRCGASTSCGASGQPCCSGATPCIARQVCGSGVCHPCGGAGQACCTTLTPACNTGRACASGYCATS